MEDALPDTRPAPSGPAQASRRRGVVAVVSRGGRLLVIRRAQTVAAPGAYCFPGGGIEPGEDEPQAIVRELLEELGARARPHRRLWECTTAWEVHLAWWQCALTSETLVPCAAEVAAVHWLLPEEVAVLPGLLDSNQRFLEALARGEIALADL
jgi:8-oxo-dGTP pyrophosphatase MutT (NUDIX family)